MNFLQRAVVSNLEAISGRHDDPAVYGGPPGDPGLCGPGSVSWRINGDLASVAHAGTSAIIMELLHPSVMAGVEEHSSYREDPFRRARTTLGYVLTTTFGNTEAATALIDQVRHIHGFIKGTRPDGVSYEAADPRLLTWVHLCIPWMILRCYERYHAPLTMAEKDQYLEEQAVIGRMGGGCDVPESMTELEAYVDTMRPQLAVTEQTLEFFEFMMTTKVLPKGTPPSLDRVLHAFFLYAGMSIAPDWARRMTGFHEPSRLQRLMIAPYLRSDSTLTRWSFGEPAFVTQAKARAVGATAPVTVGAEAWA